MPNLPDQGQWQLAHNGGPPPFEVLAVDFKAKSGTVYLLERSVGLSKLTVTPPDKFAGEYTLAGKSGRFDAEATATGLSLEFAERKGVKITASPLHAGYKFARLSLSQDAAEDRRQAVLALQTKSSPQRLDDVYSILDQVRRVERTYQGRDGEVLNQRPSDQEDALAQKALDGVYEWLRQTLDDAKLERHFRFNHEGMSYSSAQFAALRIFDAAGNLKRNATHRNGGVPERVWDDLIKQIRQDERWIKSLLGEADAQPTTSDKIAGIVILGACAIPIIGAAVVTLPEVIAAFGTASLSAAFAMPYGAATLAFVVENWAVSEVVAYFAVGTIATVLDSGGIEGFGQRLQTPEGAMQTLSDIIFFYVSVRGAKGNGYVRVRGKVIDRTPQGVRIRIESSEEVAPPPRGMPKLGNLTIKDVKVGVPGRLGATRSMGVPPEALKQKCADSIRGARLKYGERTPTCEAHQEHHIANLPKDIERESIPSPIGGAHEIVAVTHDSKRYIIDSSAKQFVREPNMHPGGIVDIQKIKDLDAQRPMLKLMDALNSGIFSAEQYDEFKKLCGCN